MMHPYFACLEFTFIIIFFHYYFCFCQCGLQGFIRWWGIDLGHSCYILHTFNEICSSCDIEGDHMTIELNMAYFLFMICATLSLKPFIVLVCLTWPIAIGELATLMRPHVGVQLFYSWFVPIRLGTIEGNWQFGIMLELGRTLNTSKPPNVDDVLLNYLALTFVGFTYWKCLKCWIGTFFLLTFTNIWMGKGFHFLQIKRLTFSPSPQHPRCSHIHSFLPINVCPHKQYLIISLASKSMTFTTSYQ